MRYLPWLWHQSYGIRKYVAVRVMVGIMQIGLGLLMVWLCKQFVDYTIRTGTSTELLQMTAWLVLSMMGSVALRQAGYYLTGLANIQQQNQLRIQVFRFLFHQHLYDGQRLHSGDVSSRLVKDVEVVGDIITSTLPQMVVTMTQLAGAFMLMHWLNQMLAWVLLLLTPISFIAGKLVARQLRQMTLDIRHDESCIQMQVQEGMEHNALLRAMEGEAWASERLFLTQQRLCTNILRRTRFMTAVRFLTGITFGMGYLLAFVWGGLGLRNGIITFGVMTSFLQLVSQIQHPILSLLNMIPQVIHATASIDRIDALRPANMSAGIGYTTGCKMSLADDGPHGIRFRDVSFDYATGGNLIFHHFNHDFRPGSKTAVIGSTGVGKTTIFRLILGFVHPHGGSISLYSATDDDGIPASETTRRHIAFVPQGNTLMSGSIRDNLLLASPGATDNELKAALHTACADFVLLLPEGLDTKVGERGCSLSEGQAQRIAIARGLLRPGSILLLDEISASLDEQTECQLYHRLFTAYPGKTMIFITHRSAVCQYCDETLLVNN